MSGATFYDRLSATAQNYFAAETYLSNLKPDEQQAIAKTIHVWGKGGTWDSFCDTIKYIFSCICCCGFVTSSWDRAVAILTESPGIGDEKTAILALNALVAKEKQYHTSSDIEESTPLLERDQL